MQDHLLREALLDLYPGFYNMCFLKRRHMHVPSSLHGHSAGSGHLAHLTRGMVPWRGRRDGAGHQDARELPAPHCPQAFLE